MAVGFQYYFTVPGCSTAVRHLYHCEGTQLACYLPAVALGWTVFPVLCLSFFDFKKPLKNRKAILRRQTTQTQAVGWIGPWTAVR